MIAANLIGYTFAVGIGHIATWYVSRLLWKELATTSSASFGELRARPFHPALVGMIERALYVASIQMAVPEFIGIWLALKVAGKWNRWSDGYGEGKGAVTGRAFFNVFLIGNGLSVAYAVVGERIVTWLMEIQFDLAVLAPLLLLMATAGIALFIKRSSNREGAA